MGHYGLLSEKHKVHSQWKNPIEDLQIKFCKSLLGVSDKTTN